MDDFAAPSQPRAAPPAAATSQPSNSAQQPPSTTTATSGPVYTAPDWAAQPPPGYYLEVLKLGSMVGKVDLAGKDHFLVGRTELNDLMAEHASVSRHHAVLQYGNDGYFYIYDLNSTHGTKINKNAVQPHRYYRLRVGQMARFGESTRVYVLHGPPEVEQQEALRAIEVEEQIRERMEGKAKAAEAGEGVSWGMGEDAVPDEDVVDDAEEEGDAALMAGFAESVAVEGQAEGGKEPFFVKDPRKALKVFFERYGEEPEFQDEERTVNRQRQHIASITLPVSTRTGEPLVVTSNGEPRKKDAIINCALKACRLLHAKNLLVPNNAVVKKKAAANEEDDDEDDEFYDRTHDRTRKEQARRKRKGAPTSDSVQTYESLQTKRESLLTQQQQLTDQIAEAEAQATGGSAGGQDELDSFMASLGAGAAKAQVKKLKKDMAQLKMELADVDKMITFLKPALAPINFPAATSTSKPLPSTGNAEIDSTKSAPAVEEAFAAQPDKGAEVKEKRVTAGASAGMARVDANATAVPAAAPPQKPVAATETSKPITALDEQARKAEVQRLLAEERAAAAAPALSTKDRLAKLQQMMAEEQADSAQQEPEEEKGGLIIKAKRTPPKAEASTSEAAPAKKLKLNPAIANAAFLRSSGAEGADTGDYQDWVPPKNQDGSGRTSLNDKLGY